MDDDEVVQPATISWLEVPYKFINLDKLLDELIAQQAAAQDTPRRDDVANQFTIRLSSRSLR